MSRGTSKENQLRKSKSDDFTKALIKDDSPLFVV